MALNLSKTLSPSLNLFIQIKPGVIYFSVFSKEKECLLKDSFILSSLDVTLLKKELETIFIHFPIQEYVFSKTYVELDSATEVFALVPNGLYVAEAQESYFNPIYALKGEEIIQGHDFSLLGLKYLFVISIQIKEAIASFFPHALIANTAYFKLQDVLFARDLEEKCVVLSAAYQGVILLVKDKNQIDFCQSFQCQNASDIAYYTLLLYSQLKLDVKEIPLYITSDNQELTQAKEVLFHYLYKVYPKELSEVLV